MAPRFVSALLTSRVSRGALVCSIVLLLGCAGQGTFGFLPRAESAPSPNGSITLLRPSGPGTTFATPRDAAIDALAYCYVAALRQVPSVRRAQAGGIFPVVGGYSYDEPTSVRRGGASVLRYRLKASDRAHFRCYPQGASGSVMRLSRTIELQARDFVDEGDPAHRPIFFLTPQRFLRVQEVADEAQTFARILFGARRNSTSISMQFEHSNEQPLAHQPERLR